MSFHTEKALRYLQLMRRTSYARNELFEKAKVYLTTPVRKEGYIDKTQVTENMVFAGETALSEKTMLNPSRVVTYAISEKDYDKTLLIDELIDPDKQVRLELWAYNPKQFSEDNSADGISIVLSFGDTNIEKLYIDWIVTPVWKQSNCADRLHKL